MATGSIISMPASGAVDWTDFPLIVTAQQAGFMAFSITNPASTVASIVGTGSVLDLAGSLFTFPAAVAITLEAATPSAAQAVYYVAKSADGTTCTITMEGTAPTWINAKQGFYGSVASLTRYVGGCYIGTAGVYYNKFIYTSESIANCLQTGKTRPILKKVVEMGEWNMDATVTATISHGLLFTKIRSVAGTIRNDADSAYQSIPSFGTSWDAAPGAQIGVQGIDAANIYISRTTGGLYDNTNYNGTASTVANRGFVFIEYEA